MAADGRVGLVFSISANTQMGESLRIVGEVEELGKWNPDKSVELYTDGKSYPTWSTAEPCWIRMKPGKKRLEYKYLRDRRQLGEGYVWEDAIPNRCLNVPAGGLWVASDRLWDCPGELKLRPGSRNSSFESRRNLVQALDCDAVAEHLFTPTQRTPEPPATPPVRRGSSSHIESPASPPGKLQREASASILCRQASELKKDSSQAQLFRENSGSCLAAEEEEVTVQRSFDAAYMLLGDEPLGEGSFGLVWRCLSRADAAGGSEERAAKRIAKARLAPRDVRNLFGDGHLEGEIKMHLGLTHAHIVGLFEVFQDDDVVSLVMECCNGGDLFDLIAKHADQGGLAEHCAARVQVHLLSALDFLHSQPVVHRDVKCENVLLAQQGVPPEHNVFKLCDFGFAARPRAPLYRLNTRMGSPDTVAPEVVRGEPYWTPVDCWAAGVLLYMSLSATPPFYAQSDAEVLQKVRHCIYKLEGKRWDFVSPDAKQLIRRLMKFEASSRATATQALSHSFLQEAQQSA